MLRNVTALLLLVVLLAGTATAQTAVTVKQINEIPQSQIDQLVALGDGVEFLMEGAVVRGTKVLTIGASYDYVEVGTNGTVSTTIQTKRAMTSGLVIRTLILK